MPVMGGVLCRLSKDETSLSRTSSAHMRRPRVAQVEPNRNSQRPSGVNVKRIATAAGLFVVLMILAGTAVAKGGVEQITVTGPGLDHPIEISDPQVLDRFNPWGGLHQFLGERLEENVVDTHALEGPYEVRFFEGVQEWGYEFSYYTAEGHEASYILLPEPPESQGFVHPAGWYRSSDAWSEVMSEQLGGVKKPTKSGEGWVGKSLVSLLAIGVIGGVVVAFLRQDRAKTRQHRTTNGVAHNPEPD